MQTGGEEIVRRISQLGAPVAEGSTDARGWRVLTADGAPAGTVDDLLVDPASREVRYLLVSVVRELAPDASVRTLRVPVGQARLEGDARLVHIGLSRTDLGGLPYDPGVPAQGDPAVHGAARGDDEIRVVLSEEQLHVSTRSVSAGEVVIRKRVETEQVRKVVPVEREDVSIERRPVPPDLTDFSPRVEGDVTYVPLVVEELVIQKRLVAREELVIRKTRVTEDQVVEETLRREIPVVEGPDGSPRAGLENGENRDAPHA